MIYRQGLVLVLIGLTGCSGMAFEPMDRTQVTPARVGLPYEDVVLTPPTGEAVRGWLLPAQGAPHSTVLVVHSATDNWDTQLLNIADLPASGVNVLLIDYATLAPSTREPVRGSLLPVRQALP